MPVTGSSLIQSRFAAVSLVVAAAVAFGAAVTIGTGAMLLALSLVPLAIVLLLWPEVKGPAVADVLHGADRRG